MENNLTELQRIGIKFFAEDGSEVDLDQLIPIFHRWIQTSAVAGLLIDVADYAHVPGGPGVMLVAHEGNYCVDLGGGRTGMLYYSKHRMEGNLLERLLALCRTVLWASCLLEQEPAVGGRLKFRGDEVRVFANDRLRAPNNEATLAAFRPVLAEFAAALYDGAGCEIAAEQDRRERFGVTIKAAQPVAIETILERLGAS